MAYNAKNAREAKGSGLPPDTILDGVIINVEDGVVKQFVPESAHQGWQGDLESPAINLTIEVKVDPNTESSVKFNQMFTYIDDKGETLFSSRSNLGKYNQKYGKLPEVGDVVKVGTTGDGFAKVKVE